MMISGEFAIKSTINFLLVILFTNEASTPFSIISSLMPNPNTYSMISTQVLVAATSPVWTLPKRSFQLATFGPPFSVIMLLQLNIAPVSKSTYPKQEHHSPPYTRSLFLSHSINGALTSWNVTPPPAMSKNTLSS